MQILDQFIVRKKMTHPFKVLSRIKRKLITSPFLFNPLFSLTKKNLRILTYHGISPGAIPVPEFEKQLQFVRDYFDCFWASEIPDLLKKEPGPRPRLVVTFDDGLKNHVLNAMPLLDKYGIKATFYIPAGLVRSQEMLWNHEVRCLLMMMDNRDLPEGIGPFSERMNKKIVDVSACIEHLKTLPLEDRQVVQESLRKSRKDKEYLPWMLEEYQLMSPDDFKCLSPLIEIGSHTLTHPILTTIPDDQLVKEIQESRDRLEELTGKPVLSFCYPNGIYSEKVVKIVEDFYPIAVSTNEGFVSPTDRRSTLKRIPAGKNREAFLIRLIRPTA
jgi:peptidoglycan/xylan/chitin deacetylase (PgdA/CDA1 family)